MHATDPSNASRTMLYDIDDVAWSDELLALFGVPADVPARGAAEQRPVRHRPTPTCAAGLEVPVSGIAGDQQAALFGQACFEPGMTKNTYGTGSFVLMNVGDELPDAGRGPAHDGRVARIGDDVTYALEGAIFVTGAAIQWLRDGLGIIADAAETGPLAASVARHRRRRLRPRVHRPRLAVLGSRTRAARSSASRRGTAARTSPAPSSRRWRTRRATSSTR